MCVYIKTSVYIKINRVSTFPKKKKKPALVKVIYTESWEIAHIGTIDTLHI